MSLLGVWNQNSELNPLLPLSLTVYLLRSHHHVRAQFKVWLTLSSSHRLHRLCRSPPSPLRLLFCLPATLYFLRKESPANVQTCLVTKKPRRPCWLPSGFLQLKALSCPCCPTASCPVTPASGIFRTSTSSSPLYQVGAPPFGDQLCLAPWRGLNNVVHRMNEWFYFKRKRFLKEFRVFCTVV